MIALKAAVFEGEQKINNRGKRSITELRHQQQVQSLNKAADVVADKNKGVIDRSARDEREHSAETQKEDQVAAKLRAKSELYEKIKSGVIAVDSGSCLVDFSGTDSRKSNEPEQSMATSLASVHVATVAGVPPSWEWSRGGGGDVEPQGMSRADHEPDTVDDYKRRKLNESKLRQHVQDEFLLRARQDDNEGGSRMLSNAARVKSQWEKTLSGTSKELLEQIHEETIKGRSAGENGDFLHLKQGGVAGTARELKMKQIRERQEALKNSKI